MRLLLKPQKWIWVSNMKYILTMAEDITNAGANVTVEEFDSWFELQDYIESYTEGMSDDERELLMSNSKIEKV